MTAQSIKAILKKHQLTLNKRGVKHLWLFGSQAIGTARLGSDIHYSVMTDDLFGVIAWKQRRCVGKEINDS